mgnify:FL=1
MFFDNLTNDNFMLYAVKSYEKPTCIMSEFREDMKRFNYIKRLFSRYKLYNDPCERLVLNHLVILNNIFGIEVSTRLLFFKINKEDHSILKTYLIFLNAMPSKIYGIRGNDIISSDIPIDLEIANILRGLK